MNPVHRRAYNRFCFTLNNWTPEEVDVLKALSYKYLILGFETAPTTGTPHIQGYVSLKKRTRWNTFKAQIPERSHIEPCRGSHAQNVDYCKKGGDFQEFGQIAQGDRVDLDGARTCAIENGMRAVTRIYGFQAIRTAEKFLAYNERVRDWVPTVWWLWGPPGVGKTQRAAEIASEYTDVYWKPPESKWWDGYDAHDCIVLDDYRGSMFKLSYLLRLLDSKPMSSEVKGGYRQILARCFIITSIKHPRDCYNLPHEPVQQLLRRITHVVHMDEIRVPEVSVPEVAGNTIPRLGRSESLWGATYAYKPQETLDDEMSI